MKTRNSKLEKELTEAIENNKVVVVIRNRGNYTKVTKLFNRVVKSINKDFEPLNTKLFAHDIKYLKYQNDKPKLQNEISKNVYHGLIFRSKKADCKYSLKVFKPKEKDFKTEIGDTIESITGSKSPNELFTELDSKLKDYRFIVFKRNVENYSDITRLYNSYIDYKGLPKGRQLSPKMPEICKEVKDLIFPIYNGKTSVKEKEISVNKKKIYFYSEPLVDKAKDEETKEEETKEEETKEIKNLTIKGDLLLELVSYLKSDCPVGIFSRTFLPECSNGVIEIEDSALDCYLKVFSPEENEILKSFLSHREEKVVSDVKAETKVSEEVVTLTNEFLTDNSKYFTSSCIKGRFFRKFLSNYNFETNVLEIQVSEIVNFLEQYSVENKFTLWEFLKEAGYGKEDKNKDKELQEIFNKYKDSWFKNKETSSFHKINSFKWYKNKVVVSIIFREKDYGVVETIDLTVDKLLEKYDEIK